MKNRFLKILAVAMVAVLLLAACGKKEEKPFVQVGDMVFYYTGEPNISGEDDKTPEAVLKETVLDYRGFEGDEKDLYFSVARPQNKFETLEQFDEMIVEVQNIQGLAAFTVTNMKVDGTKAHQATVDFNGEVITFIGFIYKDTSYLIYASAPEASAKLVDSFIQKIDLK